MEDTNRISVRFLGEFQLEVRGRSLTEEINRSKKMANLLAYLIYHRDSIISQEDLIRALWPDSRRIDPVTSLKTLIYRTRKLLQEYGFPKGSRSAKMCIRDRAPALSPRCWQARDTRRSGIGFTPSSPSPPSSAG